MGTEHYVLMYPSDRTRSGVLSEANQSWASVGEKKQNSVDSLRVLQKEKMQSSEKIAGEQKKQAWISLVTFHLHNRQGRARKRQWLALVQLEGCVLPKFLCEELNSKVIGLKGRAPGG